MKLIAVLWVSDQVPAGASFEIPDHDAASAEALILGGYARMDEVPAEPDAPAARRSYRRRDLQAEP